MAPTISHRSVSNYSSCCSMNENYWPSYNWSTVIIFSTERATEKVTSIESVWLVPTYIIQPVDKMRS